MNLSGRLDIDELREDLVGFGHQLGRALGLLVLLADHPKLHDLVAELAPEKRPEGGQTVWNPTDQPVREAARTTGTGTGRGTLNGTRGT